MDRVVTYLQGRPEGATSEEIATEAMELRGAIGAVADKVVRAVAEADERIAEAEPGRWVVRKSPQKSRIRSEAFLTYVVRNEDDRSLSITCCRSSFDGTAVSRVFNVQSERSDSTAEMFGELEDFGKGAVSSGFRLATIRSAINESSRFHFGKTVVGGGLCLSRLARRCFPKAKIRSAADIAEALDLPFVEDEDREATCGFYSNLLFGLLENSESRGLDTLESVYEDLQPTVTAVDFEAFAFDEAYLEDLPTSPGVYVMRDAEGQVVYVGKSVHLRDRVKTYFAKRSEREEKTLKILDRIWTVEVEVVGSELEALILEARLIQITRPGFNKQVKVHERANLATSRKAAVILLPSSSPDCVELFCVRADREIRQIRARKDLADWAGGWVEAETFLSESPCELDAVEKAAHHILDSWLQQNGEQAITVDVGDAGERTNLKRLLEEHIRDADNETWEKAWRV